MLPLNTLTPSLPPACSVTEYGRRASVVAPCRRTSTSSGAKPRVPASGRGGRLRHGRCGEREIDAHDLPGHGVDGARDGHGLALAQRHPGLCLHGLEDRVAARDGSLPALPTAMRRALARLEPAVDSVAAVGQGRHRHLRRDPDVLEDGRRHVLLVHGDGGLRADEQERAARVGMKQHTSTAGSPWPLRPVAASPGTGRAAAVQAPSPLPAPSPRRFLCRAPEPAASSAAHRQIPIVFLMPSPPTDCIGLLDERATRPPRSATLRGSGALRLPASAGSPSRGWPGAFPTTCGRARRAARPGRARRRPPAPCGGGVGRGARDPGPRPRASSPRRDRARPSG